MIRAALAVVLAAALLAASLPAVDDVRRDRADAAVRAEVGAVERAAADLFESDEPGAGARRVVAVDLPAASWSVAEAESVAVRRNGTVSWQVAGHVRTRRPTDPPLQPAGDRPIVLDPTGRTRLALTLSGSRDDPTVTVRRFKSDGRTTTSRARLVTPLL